GSDAVIGDPCAAPGALCISATTSSDSAATLSSIGPAVSLGAPGDQIPVPGLKGGVSTNSSTHYAAALTAGQVVRVMLNTAKDGNSQHTRVNDSIGYGIIDPAAALAASAPAQITNPLLPVVPTVIPSSGKATQPAGSGSKPAGGSGSSSSGLWAGLGIGL